MMLQSNIVSDKEEKLKKSEEEKEKERLILEKDNDLKEYKENWK